MALRFRRLGCGWSVPKRCLGFVATLVLLAGCLQADQAQTTLYDYEVVATYPHDPNAFCQGLVFDGSRLYESTGQYGNSSLRHVDLTTGKVEKQLKLNQRIFAEGLALVDDKLYQLTWKQQTGFVFDAKSLRPLGRFPYQGEGWGLTHDGNHFIMSDGTDKLRFLNTKSLRAFKTLRVKEGRRKITRLNELEFVKGMIYANIWYSNRIAIIDPETGNVTGWIDLKGLCKEHLSNESVLNGIAYDAANDRLFVTGKNWPKLYEIKIKARESKQRQTKTKKNLLKPKRSASDESPPREATPKSATLEDATL